MLYRNIVKFVQFKTSIQETVISYRAMASCKALDEPKVTLNDGNVMPMFGLGLYLGKRIPGQLRDDETETEKMTVFALQQGYRMLDTANAYGNEGSVGNAIKKSGVKREDIFVVTKANQHGYNNCLKECETSLKCLGTGYVDLYLMHSPRGGKILETYDAMLKLKEKGLVRSIGVSNFNIEMLKGLCNAGKPTPSVNQVELHMYMKRKELASYCHKHGIHLMSFSPLTRGKRLNDPEISSIAQRYNKSTAQLMIRWCIQSGYITIPKSTKENRIIENSQVFDWNINDKDMAILNTLPDESIFKSESILYKIHDLKWEDHK